MGCYQYPSPALRRAKYPVLICLLLPALISAGLAQDIKSPVALNSEHRTAYLVDELLVYADSTGSLGFQQIRQASTLVFVPGDRIGRPGRVPYWARVTVISNFDHDVRYRISAAWWDFVELYVVYPNDSVVTIATGLLRPRSEQGNSDFATFTLPAHASIQLIARLSTSGHFMRMENVNLFLRPHELSLENERYWIYLSGILVGILIGFAFYNLSFSASGLDGSYGWYFVYLLSLAVSFSGQMGTNTSYLTQFFLPEYPLVGLFMKRFSDPIAFVSLILFSMYFLGTRSKYPRWHKVLMMTGVSEILFFSFWSIGLDVRNTIGLLIHIGAVTVVLIAAINAYKGGFRVAKFFILGQALVLFGVVYSFSVIKLDSDLLWFLPKTRFFDFLKSSNPFFFGAVEALIFSLALTDRQQAKLETQVVQRTKELNESLNNLKSTQAQLVQSEKMASLGELTAGIAHEIQNPLNFVNNFSELNTELANELEAAAQSGELDQVKSIAKDIKENEEKINHHGKRAGSIVKGMLQHSRASSGKKEPTDINALCDEYLRLAYHGLRAKDKSFNAKFETHLDPALPRIDVVPQDIGRVVLNLVNNAFYAISERLRQAQPDSGYEPTVVVSTRRVDSPMGARGSAGSIKAIAIIVTDNGNGIPASIKDKIFQPFFTTKPTGQGTGLGLSLSYDIITKGHGGELQVETHEGKGSTFTITLPA